MSTENDKHAAQTALPENIRDLYQQIISEGYVYQVGQSLTRQIADGQFPSPKTQQPDIIRSVEQEQDVEPER